MEVSLKEAVAAQPPTNPDEPGPEHAILQMLEKIETLRAADLNTPWHAAQASKVSRGACLKCGHDVTTRHPRKKCPNGGYTHDSCLESHAIGILGDLALTPSGPNTAALKQLLALYFHKHLKTSKHDGLVDHAAVGSAAI